MPNGKPGDHPLTDIVVHGHDVYSPAADALVREIAAAADAATYRELGDLLDLRFNDAERPNVPELERVLREMLDRMRRGGGDRGGQVRH